MQYTQNITVSNCDTVFVDSAKMDNTTKLEEYYTILPACITQNTELSLRAKTLFADILALTQKEGFCWATNEYFATKYSVNKRTISRAIKELCHAQVISTNIEHNKINFDGLNRRCIKINNEKINEKFTSNNKIKTTRWNDNNVSDNDNNVNANDKNVSGGVTKMSVGSDKNVTHNNINNNKEINNKKENKKREILLSQISQFANKYNISISLKEKDFDNFAYDEIDIDLLERQYNNSNFLQRHEIVDCHWILKHYDNIINGKYQNFYTCSNGTNYYANQGNTNTLNATDKNHYIELKNETKNPKLILTHQYTKEDLDSAFSPLDQLW